MIASMCSPSVIDGALPPSLLPGVPALEPGCWVGVLPREGLSAEEEGTEGALVVVAGGMGCEGLKEDEDDDEGEELVSDSSCDKMLVDDEGGTCWGVPLFSDPVRLI